MSCVQRIAEGPEGWIAAADRVAVGEAGVVGFYAQCGEFAREVRQGLVVDPVEGIRIAADQSACDGQRVLCRQQCMRLGQQVRDRRMAGVADQREVAFLAVAVDDGQMAQFRQQRQCRPANGSQLLQRLAQSGIGEALDVARAVEDGARCVRSRPINSRIGSSVRNGMPVSIGSTASPP